MNMLAKFCAAVAVACMVTFVGSIGEAAVSIGFDPNGTGGATSIPMSQMDWLPGNALAQGVFSTPNLLAPAPIGTSFTLLYQAQLSSLVEPNGTPVMPGTIFTVVAEFQEDVTFSQRITSPTTTTDIYNFGLKPGAPNFVQVYAGSSPNAAAGTGFNTGTLIYSGTVVGSQSGVPGTFTTNVSNTAVSNYMSSGNTSGFPALSPNNSSVKTIGGSGGFSVTVQTDSYSSNYFQLPPNTLLGFTFTNGNNNVPFPSGQTSSASILGQTPNIGTINGLNTGVAGKTSGHDFQFSADANTSFTITPEPASIGIWCVLGAVSFVGRRFSRRSKGENLV